MIRQGPIPANVKRLTLDRLLRVVARIDASPLLREYERRDWIANLCDAWRREHEHDCIVPNRRTGLAWLMREGDLRCFSQYGSGTYECAPVAWRLAYLIARETGEAITIATLEYAMGLVVNEHDDVAYMIRTYGNYDYGRA
jgi:hypothetical protein